VLVPGVAAKLYLWLFCSAKAAGSRLFVIHAIVTTAQPFLVLLSCSTKLRGGLEA